MPRVPVAERRAALVQAALRVIARRGVATATTRAIVEEAGMSLASFHYAFTSRDELLHEVIVFVVSQEQAAVLPAPAQCGQSLRDVIRHGLQRYAEHLRADPLREQAMLELTQHALRSAGMEELARLQYDTYRALAAAALATAAEQAGAAWTLPLEHVARFLVVLTDGLTLSWLVERDDAGAAAVMDCAADAIAALGATHRVEPSGALGATDRVEPSGALGATHRVEPSGALGAMDRVEPSGALGAMDRVEQGGAR